MELRKMNFFFIIWFTIDSLPLDNRMIMVIGDNDNSMQPKKSTGNQTLATGWILARLDS